MIKPKITYPFLIFISVCTTIALIVFYQMNQEYLFETTTPNGIKVSLTSIEPKYGISHGAVLISWQNVNPNLYRSKDAHLYEHMLISRQEITGQFEGVLDYFRSINGEFRVTAGEDHIHIKFSVKDDYLLESLGILSKAISEPEVTETDFLKVTQIIRNEWRIRASGTRLIAKSRFHDESLCNIYGERLHIYCQPFDADDESDYSAYSTKFFPDFYKQQIKKSEVYFSIITSISPSSMLRPVTNILSSIEGYEGPGPHSSRPTQTTKSGAIEGDRPDKAFFIANFGSCPFPVNILIGDQLMPIIDGVREELSDELTQSITFTNITCDMERRWVYILGIESDDLPEKGNAWKNEFSSAVKNRIPELYAQIFHESITNKNIEGLVQAGRYIEAAWLRVAVKLAQRNVSISDPNISLQYSFISEDKDAREEIRNSATQKLDGAGPVPSVKYKFLPLNKDSLGTVNLSCDEDKSGLKTEYRIINNDASKNWGDIYAYIYLPVLIFDKQNIYGLYSEPVKNIVLNNGLNTTIDNNSRSITIDIDESTSISLYFYGPTLKILAYNISNENSAIEVTTLINDLFLDIAKIHLQAPEAGVNDINRTMDDYQNELDTHARTGVGIIQSIKNLFYTHDCMPRTMRNAELEITYYGGSSNKLQSYLKENGLTKKSDKTIFDVQQIGTNGASGHIEIINNELHNIIGLNINGIIKDTKDYALANLLIYILNLESSRFFRSEIGVSYHASVYLLKADKNLQLAIYMDLSADMPESEKVRIVKQFLRGISFDGYKFNRNFFDRAIERFNQNTTVLADGENYLHLNEFGFVKVASDSSSIPHLNTNSVSTEMKKIRKSDMVEFHDSLLTQLDFKD